MCTLKYTHYAYDECAPTREHKPGICLPAAPAAYLFALHRHPAGLSCPGAVHAQYLGYAHRGMGRTFLQRDREIRVRTAKKHPAHSLPRSAPGTHQKGSHLHATTQHNTTQWVLDRVVLWPFLYYVAVVLCCGNAPSACPGASKPPLREFVTR